MTYMTCYMTPKCLIYMLILESSTQVANLFYLMMKFCNRVVLSELVNWTMFLLAYFMSESTLRVPLLQFLI